MRTSFTCLFWNTNGRDRTGLVGQLSAQVQADVVVLAEPGVASEAVLTELRRAVDESYREPHTETRRLYLFGRNDGLGLREIYGDTLGRVTVRLLHLGQNVLLFAALHLPSKLHFGPADRTAEAQVISEEIRRIEVERGHRRTIVVGDLNMNPFEAGVAQASGFHGMMSKATVMADDRTVQGREYPFFYNPMWGFFGDRTDGPPGTYHYRHSGHLSYDWNIFDQLLVRPDVLRSFDTDVEIVSEIGQVGLLGRDGLPDADVGSDHLPIVFRLAAVE